jgi:uncharacterized membrane protein
VRWRIVANQHDWSVDMKAIFEFIKTCLLGGMFVLLPLLIFYLLSSELIDVIVALATPIADLFPDETFAKLSDPMFVAILLLLVTSFVFGLALRSRTLTRAGNWIERTTLMRLPLYNAVKRLSQGLTGAGTGRAFKSGLLHGKDGTSELVYIIEEHADGKLTLLLPLAPAGFTGAVKIVPGEQVTRLNANVGEASEVIAHWGVGMSDLLKSP